MGQTKNGLQTRGDQHNSEAKSGSKKQLVSEEISRAGVDAGIWLPMKAWTSPPVQVTKKMRLESEGGYIFERQPELNREGRHADAVNYEYRDRVLATKHRTFRSFIRLRRRTPRLLILTAEEKEKAPRSEQLQLRRCPRRKQRP